MERRSHAQQGHAKVKVGGKTVQRLVVPSRVYEFKKIGTSFKLGTIY